MQKRSPQIRWKLVIHHLLEIIASIIYAYCLFDRFCLPTLRQLDIKKLDAKLYAQLITSFVLPGALIQMISMFT